MHELRLSPMVGLIWSSGKKRSSSLKKLARRPVICKPAASTSSCGIRKPKPAPKKHCTTLGCQKGARPGYVHCSACGGGKRCTTLGAWLPEWRPQRVRPLHRMRWRRALHHAGLPERRPPRARPLHRMRWRPALHGAGLQQGCPQIGCPLPVACLPWLSRSSGSRACASRAAAALRSTPLRGINTGAAPCRRRGRLTSQSGL